MAGLRVVERRESDIGVSDGATRTKRAERSNRVRRVRPPRYQENMNADTSQTKGVLSFLEREKKTRGSGGGGGGGGGGGRARKKEPPSAAGRKESTHKRRREASRRGEEQPAAGARRDATTLVGRFRKSNREEHRAPPLGSNRLPGDPLGECYPGRGCAATRRRNSTLIAAIHASRHVQRN